MKFISYAQNFEDVMLWRALGHIQDGFYIDVGAWSPQDDSVTRALYERGWSGIDIEPNPDWAVEYASHRQRDIFLNIALGEVRTRSLIYIPTLSGLSSLLPERQNSLKLLEKKGREIEVEVFTLKDIFSEYVKGRDVHFLKIDVEGLEAQVILGNDWQNFRPWIIVIEATVPNSSKENSDSWAHLLLEADYLLAYKDGLNHFYVAKEHQELLLAFSFPPNIFDNYSLAIHEVMKLNLLAYKEQIQKLEGLVKKADAESLERFVQVDKLTGLLKISEADRMLRNKQIEDLTGLVKKTEAESMARFDKINKLTAMLKECEAESMARFDQINKLTAMLKECEVDSQDRFNQIQVLNTLIEKLQ